MQETGGPRRLLALVLVADSAAAVEIVAVCKAHGMETKVRTDAAGALEICRDRPPDLAIVDADLESMPGIEFLRDLLKISWTTAGILITSDDEETVHEKTEGLGILGHISDYRDRDGLEKLLRVHRDLTGDRSTLAGRPEET